MSTSHELAEELIRQIAIKERLLFWVLSMHRGMGDPRGWEDSHEHRLNEFLEELGYDTAGERATAMLQLGEPGRHMAPDVRVDRILAQIIRIDPIEPRFPMLHPRHQSFQQAKIALSDAVLGWLDKHPRLTFAEIVLCLSNEIHSWSSLMVREERYVEKEEGDEQR